MYRLSGSNGNNSKMATEKKGGIKYIPTSRRLHEHFGFELLADGNMIYFDKVYCIHCDRTFGMSWI